MDAQPWANLISNSIPLMTSFNGELVRTLSQYLGLIVFRKYEGLICSSTKTCGGGRPHIVYHEKAKKYVLWTDFGLSGYQVSTSSSIAGPFVKSPTRAALDPTHRGLKPADFAIATISR
jgi:hypothetical protein